MARNTVIFGDSYSTFEGYIPEGYDTYYSPEAFPENGVTKAEQTWWHQVVKEADLRLLLNNSWSGSTIGYIGYDNRDCSGDSSFIFRLRQLEKQGFFAENRVDTVFVFGGTNDSWADAPLGVEKLQDWEEQDLYCVLPAVFCFFKSLKAQLPEAEIYCLINTELKPEITSAMRRACSAYEITPVCFETIEKISGHPTVHGMRQICDAVLQVMRQHL